MAKHCTNCGHELRETDKFCASCGTAVDAMSTGVTQQPAPRTEATTDGRIRCPNPACPQPDDVRSVSTVVQTGTSQGQLAGYYTVTSQSALSTQLAPPLPPSKVNWQLAWPFAALALPGIIYDVTIIVAVVLGLFGVNSAQWQQQIASATPHDYLVLFLVTIGLNLLIVAVVWVIGGSQRDFARDYPLWQQAVKKWDHLYYCNRCGSVFNPMEGDRFVPASRMKELLV